MVATQDGFLFTSLAKTDPAYYIQGVFVLGFFEHGLEIIHKPTSGSFQCVVRRKRDGIVKIHCLYPFQMCNAFYVF